MSSNTVTTKEVFVRLVTKDDELEWKRLWKLFQISHKASLSDEVNDGTFKRCIDPDVKMWAAVAINPDTNKPIGMVNYFSHMQTWDIKDKIVLHDLYVDEHARVKGVGRKLIQFVYDHADRLQTPFVYWFTHDDNYAAQLLYSKVGYRTDIIEYKKDRVLGIMSGIFARSAI